jgi:hypothetical protein
MKIYVGLMAALALLGFGVFAQDAKHTIGERFGGGIVFYVTPNGQHGLIAESIDQSQGKARLDILGNPALHSEEGKNYTDWRIPTYTELQMLLKAREIVGAFSKGNYLYLSINRLSGDTLGFTLSAFDLETGNSYYSWQRANVRLIRSF